MEQFCLLSCTLHFSLTMLPSLSRELHLHSSTSGYYQHGGTKVFRALPGSCLIGTHYFIFLTSWVKDMLEWMQMSPLLAQSSPGLLNKVTKEGGGDVFLGANNTCAQVPGHHTDTSDWASLRIRSPTSTPHPWAPQPVSLHSADILKPFNSFQMCQKADTRSLVFTLCFTFVSAFQ